jgi:hypothetical protein
MFDLLFLTEFFDSVVGDYYLSFHFTFITTVRNMDVIRLQRVLKRAHATF